MSHGRFADRLNVDTYADDPSIGIWEVDPGDADAVWLPERLLSRLVHLGAAYELHTLPMLGGPDPVRLNSERCASLIDELDFISDRVDDSVAHATISALTAYLSARTRRPSWSGHVTFDCN